MNVEKYDDIENDNTKELMVELLNAASEFREKRNDLLNQVSYGGDDDDFEFASDVVSEFMENSIIEINKIRIKLIEIGEFNRFEQWLSNNGYMLTINHITGDFIDIGSQ